MTYPLAHKVHKPRGDWVPSFSTDIRIGHDAERHRLEAIDFLMRLSALSKALTLHCAEKP